MKKLRILSLLMIIGFSMNAQVLTKEISVGDTLRVFVNSGLNLRTTPNGKKIVTLKYGSPVVVKALTTHDDLIENRTGIWLSVQSSSGKNGYVFSGFTTKHHVVDFSTEEASCNPHSNFHQWMGDVFRHAAQISQTLINFRGNASDQRDACSNQEMEFSNGVKISSIEGNGTSSMLIESSHIDLNDLINLFDSIRKRYENSNCTHFNSSELSFRVNRNKQNNLVFSSKMSDFKVFLFGNKMIFSYSVESCC